MAAAVAAAVAIGQPPAAAPGGGRTVPVRSGGIRATGGGRALAVIGSGLRVIDLGAGTARAVHLPAGIRARQVVALAGGAGSTVIVDPARGIAYLLRAGVVRRLGRATAALPGTDGGAWLIDVRTAREVGGPAGSAVGRIGLPPGGTVVGATAGGLVVDTGRPGAAGAISVVTATGLRRVGSGRALAVAGHRVLLRRSGRLGYVDLPNPIVHWLPRLLAVRQTGLAALSADGRMVAVLGRSGHRQRLIAGPADAAAGRDLTVLPLDGGSRPPTPAPVWVSADTVLGVRPDGRLVRYRVGAPAGVLLAPAPMPVRALSAG